MCVAVSDGLPGKSLSVNLVQCHTTMCSALLYLKSFFVQKQIKAIHKMHKSLIDICLSALCNNIHLIGIPWFAHDLGK